MPNLNNFLKEKLSHFYVLLLIFLIPVLIIVNGLWRISAYQSNINTELKQKTELVTKLLSGSLSSDMANVNHLQNDLLSAKKSSAEVEDLTIFANAGNDFAVLASTNPEFNNVSFPDSDLLKVWNNDSIIVKEYKNIDQSPSKRSWLGLVTIKSEAGEKQALLAIKINSAAIDNLSRSSINFSLVTLVITVFIVFLLLINHFRFFEYFINYRKIQQIDKMKDEFISIVSHELKTPLATVKGYMDMMFQGLTGKFDETARKHLIKISMNIQRLDLLINELLDVSRIEQDRLQYDMQPVDISKVSESVIAELDSKALSKGLKISHEPIEQMPAIFADPDRVHQVIENLVSNAIKYTQKGKITIGYKLEKGKIVTSIEDTGIGMSPSDMKRLFDRFYRIKNEKTMDISGTGLGLWIAKAIAKRMNGDITVQSKENIGSKFSVIFPFIKN